MQDIIKVCTRQFDIAVVAEARLDEV